MKKFLTVLVLLIVTVTVFAGEWYPYIQTDKITDETSFALIYIDETQKAGMLSVLFTGGNMIFAVITNKYFSEDDTKVIYRFDSEKAVTVSGITGTNNTSVIFYNNDFLEKLKTCTTLIIRVKPYKDPYIDFEIDLTGFNEMYKMSEPVITSIMD